MKKIKTKLKQQIGRAEKTVDVEYDRLVQNYEKEIEQLKDVKKAIEKHKQIVGSLGTSFKELFVSIKNFYANDAFNVPCTGINVNAKNASRYGKVEAASSIFYELSMSCATVLQDAIEQTEEWILGMRGLRKRLDLRQEKRLSFDVAKDEFFTLQQALPQNQSEMDRLRESHDRYKIAKHDYQRVHTEVFSELTIINDKRYDDFEPIFSTIATAHSEYFQDACSAFIPFQEVTVKKPGVDIPRLPPRKIPIQSPKMLSPPNSTNNKTLTQPTKKIETPVSLDHIPPSILNQPVRRKAASDDTIVQAYHNNLQRQQLNESPLSFSHPDQSNYEFLSQQQQYYSDDAVMNAQWWSSHQTSDTSSGGEFQYANYHNESATDYDYQNQYYDPSMNHYDTYNEPPPNTAPNPAPPEDQSEGDDEFMQKLIERLQSST